MITGEAGCGKIMLIRHLLNQRNRDVTVGLISNAANLTHNLLKWIQLERIRLDCVSETNHNLNLVGGQARIGQDRTGQALWLGETL